MGIFRHLSFITFTTTLMAVFALVGGCDVSSESTDRFQAASLFDNGVWDNGVWDNGVWDNGVWDNGVWDNGVWDNGVWDNGVWDNGVWDNGPIWPWIAWNSADFDGITEVPMTADALQDTIVVEVLEDEYGHRFFEKLVLCALDADQSVILTVAGEELTYVGGAGLAPEWGDEDGDCDDDCQGWVSACLISRNNAHGESIRISMRGEHDALALGETEAEDFPHAEATYFGNLFHPYPDMYACVADGETEIPRTCTDDSCLATNVGTCSDVCEDDECEVDGQVFDEPISVFNSDETYEHYYGA